jgi:prophage antirepressor-like protein
MNAITTYPTLNLNPITIIDQNGNDDAIEVTVAAIFNFHDHPIRTIQLSEDCIDDLSGEPWFIAEDACEALGICPKRALSNVHPSHKDIIMETTSGNESVVVNESGLYELIFQSQKPEAQDFSAVVNAGYLPELETADADSYPTARQRCQHHHHRQRPSMDRLATRGREIRQAPRQCDPSHPQP